MMGRVCTLALTGLLLLHAPQVLASPWTRLRGRARTELRRARTELHHIADRFKQARQRIAGSKPVVVVVEGAKKAGRWVKNNPGKAAAVGVGAAAMFGVVFYAAPALSTAIGTWLTPVAGKTAADIAGVAAGGALASGSRSLLVHSTPMLLKIDPLNVKQLATDVGMSSGFGFVGFAHAATLRSLTRGLGATGVGLFAVNAVGLIGYEMFKDYLQNRIRNRVANDPKRFRDIWKGSLAMETASNLHRCIPGLGLETNFAAKIIGDLGGTIWWDRLINKRNKTAGAAPTPDTRTACARERPDEKIAAPSK
ncbi:MAG: hypothetical protein KC503_40695 [Myxococcales bacterium]|nr:hypothetical protein [Myxococcales bacterium]